MERLAYHPYIQELLLDKEIYCLHKLVKILAATIKLEQISTIKETTNTTV